MAAFERDIEVRFGDTDPAGIVYYPRYFDMLNRVIEDWFAHALGYPFRRMHLEGRRGVPTVNLETLFQNPSRLGDILRFSLTVRRIGAKSATLTIQATCDGEVRLTCRQIIVHSSVGLGREMRAEPWPDDVRRRIEEHLDKGEPELTIADDA